MSIRDDVNLTISGMQEVENNYVEKNNFHFRPAVISCDFKGRKYWRVVRDFNGQRSVEFFVNAETGDVYKGSWTAPADRVARFNVSTTAGRERLFFHASQARYGYLYKGRIAKADEVMSNM